MQKIDNQCVIREQIAANEFVDLIPHFVQKRLKTFDLFLTCLDVIVEYFVFGSNIGIVYLIDRQTKNLQKLICDDNDHNLTCVKIQPTVDYMIAAANQMGLVNVFLLPKKPSDDLPVLLKQQILERKKIKFGITLHRTEVTTLVWSKNGIRLFCGDKNGTVSVTEFDFNLNVCKTSEIIKMDTEIVQLSYYKEKLLISTVSEVLLGSYDFKWKFTHVSRKTDDLNKYGSTFLLNRDSPDLFFILLANSNRELNVFDQKAEIISTLEFPETDNEIFLLNPISENLLSAKIFDNSVQKLTQFSNRFFIAYNSSVFYVFNIENQQTVAKCSYLRKITGLAVCNENIFILENNRSLICLTAFDMNSDVEEAVEVVETQQTKLDLAVSERIRSKHDRFQPISNQLFSNDFVVERDSKIYEISENNNNE